MPENKGQKRLGYESGIEGQPVLADDAGAQTLERGELKRIDHLVERLIRLKQLGKGTAEQIDLIQVAASLKQCLDGRSRARMCLRQDVQRRVSLLFFFYLFKN